MIDLKEKNEMSKEHDVILKVKWSIFKKHSLKTKNF